MDLAAALLGQAQPPAAVAPAPVISAPERPADPPAAPAPKPAKIAAPKPAAPAAPVAYRLTDSAGTVWTHADPENLRRWVAARNAQLSAAPPAFTVAPRYYYAPAYPSPCAGGRCPR